MKIRNKKRFVICAILLAVVLVVGGVFALLNRSDSQYAAEISGMQTIYLLGNSEHYEETIFKTRDGSEEGGDIIVTLASPPIGRRKATVLVGFKDMSNNTVVSAEITEGETVHIKNDCHAGEYLQPFFVNLSATSDDENLTINYKITPDELPADIEKPSAG